MSGGIEGCLREAGETFQFVMYVVRQHHFMRAGPFSVFYLARMSAHFPRESSDKDIESLRSARRVADVRSVQGAH